MGRFPPRLRPGRTALSLGAGASLLKTLPPGAAAHGPDQVRTTDPSPSGRRRTAPFLVVGVLGALAFASENAHQSWSAVFAQDGLHAGTGPSAVAPAVFAGTVAITRFSVSGLGAAHARAVLLAGALAAAAGATIIATAPTLLIAGLGLAAAGGGTAVLFPTLLGVVSRNVDESRRGRATSVVTTVSYLGFLIGPFYVGLWADAVGLRGAMVAVAALAVGLFVLTPALLHLSGLSESRVSAPHRDDERGAPEREPGLPEVGVPGESVLVRFGCRFDHAGLATPSPAAIDAATRAPAGDRSCIHQACRAGRAVDWTARPGSRST
jgi:MFS family permease